MVRMGGSVCGVACGISFKPRHANIRALRHVLKLNGGDIAICKAAITARYQERYQALYDRQFIRIDSKRKSDKIIRDSVTVQQEAAVRSLLDTRKQPGVSGVRKSPHRFSSSHVASASGGAGRSSSSTSSLHGQRSVSTMHQLDIQRSNDAKVEMAIADFFHCENIPDAVVESSQFKQLISVFRLLGDKFVPPNASKIGGPFLTLILR